MNPTRILIVEDNPADADLAKETLETHTPAIEVSIASDGLQAMELLCSTERQRPDMVLLDLNLPGLSGRDILAEIRADAKLRSMPVVVLSSSGAEEDLVSSYELGANAYVKKPLGLTTFRQTIGTMMDFWFSVVRLPSTGGYAHEGSLPGERR